MLNKIIIFLILLSCAALAFPGTINYQGILKDSSGNPLSGSYTVVFTIYDAASGGTSQWTETRTVSVEAGLYNIKLGSVTPLTTTVFSEDTRYLGVKVESDAEMTPRVALVSVPYAFRAGIADTVSGMTGSYVILGTSETQTTSNPIGVRIKSTHTSGYGGAFYSNGGQNSVAIYGEHESLGSDLTYGGYFLNNGESGRGVYAFANNSSGTNYGGYFVSNGSTGTGVYGRAQNNLGSQTYGGSFLADSSNGTGVFGEGWKHGGVFESHGTEGAGVWGIAHGLSGVGVTGEAKFSTGVGVYGKGVSGGIAVYVDDVLYLKPRIAAPGVPQDGMMYYDSTLNCLRYYGNSTWHNL